MRVEKVDWETFVLGAIITVVSFASMIYLVGCGSGSSEENTASELRAEISNSAPWPIQVLITQDQTGYVHMDVTVNNKPHHCIFDTGAPGIWLPPEMAYQATVVVGNYERTNVDAYDLAEDMSWVGCLIGPPFFLGMTEYRVDLVDGILEFR